MATRDNKILGWREAQKPGDEFKVQNHEWIAECSPTCIVETCAAFESR